MKTHLTLITEGTADVCHGQRLRVVIGDRVCDSRLIEPNQQHPHAIAAALRELASMLEQRPQQPMDKNFLNQMAQDVSARLPDNYGFIVFAFPFQDGGRMLYTSNAQRADAVNALKEWLIQASGEEEWMKHIT